MVVTVGVDVPEDTRCTPRIVFDQLEPTHHAAAAPSPLPAFSHRSSR